MLPLLNLQAIELGAFDAQSSATGLLPDDANAFDGAFSDILKLGVTAQDNGEELPASGRELPLLPVIDAKLVELVADRASISDQLGPLDAVLPQPPSPPTLDTLQDLTAAVMVEQTADLLPQHEDGADGLAAPTPELPPLIPDWLALDHGQGTLTLGYAATGGEQNSTPILSAIAAAQSADASTAMQRDANVAHAIQPGPTIPTVADSMRQLLSDRASGAMPPAATNRPPINQDLELRRPLTMSTRASLAPHGEPAPLAVEINDVDPDLPGPRTRPPTTAVGEELVRTLREDQLISPRPQPATSTQPVVAALETALAVESSARPIAATSSTTLRPAVGQAVSTPIDVPVQDVSWDRVVSERVLMMANGRLQNADIRLTPAELGPLRIQVAIEDGTANVAFQAQHAVTREAIELAMPRLREMLAENGLSLGQADVSDQGVRDGGQDAAASAHGGVDVAVDEPDAGEQSLTGQELRLGDGLVDTFV